MELVIRGILMVVAVLNKTKIILATQGINLYQ